MGHFRSQRRNENESLKEIGKILNWHYQQQNSDLTNKPNSSHSSRHRLRPSNSHDRRSPPTGRHVTDQLSGHAPAAPGRSRGGAGPVPTDPVCKLGFDEYGTAAVRVTRRTGSSQPADRRRISSMAADAGASWRRAAGAVRALRSGGPCRARDLMHNSLWVAINVGGLMFRSK